MLVTVSFCTFAETAWGTEILVSVSPAWSCTHALVKNYFCGSFKYVKFGVLGT